MVLPDDVFQLCAQAVGDWLRGLLVEERQDRYGRFQRPLGPQAGMRGRGEPTGCSCTWVR
ncbi:hypothetical protein AQJ46_40660 [Streptomyces canus]|uniref:Uncharacterized protein n=1 Tax=Streptomyces canus TaxID=58343 RepID=A0A101RPF3_9ACTN|nr:hypothetical protein AQJ46_40660 [Streptomyces canus]